MMRSWWTFIANFITWCAVFLALNLEFFLRRVEALLSGADLEVVLPDGGKRDLREMLTEIVIKRTTGGTREPPTDLGLVSKFAASPQDLVTGKPVDAPLGIEHFMRVRLDFAMPTVSLGIEAICAEVEAHGSAVDKECLNYVLRERAGSSSEVFSNGNLKRDCTSDGAIHPLRLNADGRGKSFEDFCSDPRAATIAMLAPPHVLALRLYTTAAFRTLNAPLRNTDPNRPAHGFPCTIKYICEGIGKLRAVDAASGDDGPLDLWRGLKNLRVHDDFKRRGGTECAGRSHSCARSRNFPPGTETSWLLTARVRLPFPSQAGAHVDNH